MQIDVRFDTSMDVQTTSGVPSLLLVVGPLSRFGSAQYKSGSGTSVLRFDYDVADGDVAPDLGYAGATALALNGAEILDIGEAYVAMLTLPAPGSGSSLSGTSAVVLDGTKRRIFSIGPASVEAEEGEPLRFTISLDRAGQPWMGSVDYATSAAPGDAAVAGVDYIASASQVSFGESDDAAMIEIKTLEDDIDEFDETFTVQLGEPSSGSSISGVADEAAATGRILDDDESMVAGVSAADGLYIAGDVVSVDVTFTTAVAVDTSGGVPRLLLETGTTDRHAVYAAGTGTATLTFDYTVEAGDASGDLQYVGRGSLTLNGGTVAALSDNVPAVLTLPALSAPESLAGSSAVVVDTAKSRTFSIAEARGEEGDDIEFTVELSAVGQPLMASVDYAVGSATDDTAEEGTDYTPVSATPLDFGPQVFERRFDVATVEDNIAEADETFTATLSNASARTMLSNSGFAARGHDRRR